MLENRRKSSKRESYLLNMNNIQIDDKIYKEMIIKELQEKNDSLMAKEIDEYVEHSMKRMYNEMDEIKKQYEESIKEALGNYSNYTLSLLLLRPIF